MSRSCYLSICIGIDVRVLKDMALPSIALVRPHRRPTRERYCLRAGAFQCIPPMPHNHGNIPVEANFDSVAVDCEITLAIFHKLQPLGAIQKTASNVRLDVVLGRELFQLAKSRRA